MGRLHWPTAWVRLSLLLEDFGQPEPDRLIELAGHPLDFAVTINAFNQADTAQLTIALDDYPLSPRLLRGATVEVFVADSERPVDATWWLEKTPEELRELALFAGVVDQSKTTIDNQFRTAELRCRDYTAYFLDAELEGDAVTYVEGGRKLSFEEILRKLLDQRDTTRAIEIDYRAPELFPADYKRRADDPKTGSRRRRQGETVWEAVQELALEAGFVVYVELDRVVVREPETIFVGTEVAPQTLRWVLGGAQAGVARLVTSRDLGRQHGINVVVTCYDPDTKRTLKAYAPRVPEDEPREAIAPAKLGGKGKRATKKTTRTTFRPFVVRGIRSAEQLQRIANQIRATLRHHELEASIETSDMADANGLRVQAIRYGDAVEIALAADLASVIAEPVDVQVRRLLEIGYPEKDAQAIALGLDRLQVPFYVHKATHRFSSKGDDGYSLEIEVRSRKQIDLGEDVKAAQKYRVDFEITSEPVQP